MSELGKYDPKRINKLFADLNKRIDTLTRDNKRLTATCSELATENERLEQYHELLYAVETKTPGESRHQTALRYISERESRVSGPSQALEQGG